jgi:spermidine synthase
LKNRVPLLQIVLLQLLAGLAISLFSTLLIYFKQKPLLHHAAILLAVSCIYFGFYFISKKIITPPGYLRSTALILLIAICWSAPQLIYQIRPYTFYISGFVVGSTVLLALSANTLQIHSFPLRNLMIFFTGYLAGILLNPGILQYLIAGLLLVCLGVYYYLHKPGFSLTLLLVCSYLLAGQLFWQYSNPIVFYGEQKDYEDKVLYSAKTQFHKLVITQWQEDQWFYIDRLKNLSTIDEYLFYEPMVHGVFSVSENINKVLVIGGENGCMLREILKYEEVSSISAVSYDTLLRNLGMENQYFTSMNDHAYDHPKVKIIDAYLLDFVSNSDEQFDAIFIDLPDPRSIESNQYYTIEFYAFLKKLLNEDGVLVTQAGSPYFATQAFFTIGHTLEKSGFHTLPIHNQILTLGEWGWHICSLKKDEETMKNQIIDFNKTMVDTKWWNQEAAKLVTAFGKTYSDTLRLRINTLDNPLVYQYYLKGNWDMN